ncbi:MAG: alanine--tRNA ligase, partial [Candidatus Aminicenantes bacterium]|nr:alanine--tRNA ligase [Candidatus Aminicenantes bacterium]
MKSDEIRTRFLEYFRKREHKIVPSSSLIPHKDPTLLFTNAGMNQFKEVFLGKEKRPYTRAASSQKCMRAGGKHNDLDNVGLTDKHHTFFEMLGNFSFGDYFKKEAIEMSWELLIEGYGLPEDRMLVSVYQKDDEAYNIWNKNVGLDPSIIYRLGEKDNFWAMGDTGPCGPCSEIHYDRGKKFGCGRPDCGIECDCDRFFELWNLVFMQYNRDEKGELSPLPSPCIDTGMGLERLATLLQGAKSNYENDLFQPIVERLLELGNLEQGASRKEDIAIRIIADHLRAITFAVSDGVMPSNEGRGYVLRRIIRRAIRQGQLMGFTEPFLYKLTGLVAHIMKSPFPELMDSRDFVARVCLAEEERFHTTLTQGIRQVEEVLEKVVSSKGTTVPGGELFRLYDTFGVPLDLVEEIAAERGLTVDHQGFQKHLEGQREKARLAWLEGAEEEVKDVYRKLAPRTKTAFAGYETTTIEDASIVAIIKGTQQVERLSKEEEGEVILDRTPFYAEAGGQVGDKGTLSSDSGTALVTDTLYATEDIIVHLVKVRHGELVTSEKVRAEVNKEERAATAANHTATHMLQATLREHLGTHIKQAGSEVTPEKMRFDFTHFSPITPRELRRIEEAVNKRIRENLAVKTEVVDYNQAIAKGAIALFGEKYQEKVRMVAVNDISRELCGGTHTRFTGDIGAFLILSECGIAAGVRRIEALTGREAIKRIQQRDETIEELSQLLKTEPQQIVAQVEKLMETGKKSQKELERLRLKLASGGGEAPMEERLVQGVKVVAQKLMDFDPSSLRNYSDVVKSRIKSGVVVLGSNFNDKASLLVALTPDLTNRLNAVTIIRDIAKIVGG